MPLWHHELLQELHAHHFSYRNPPFESTSTEITLTPSGLRLILNLTLCPLKPGPLLVHSPSHSKDLPAYLLEGGEKLLFTPDSAHWILTTLLDNIPIDLCVDRYRTTLPPLNLPTLWATLPHAP